MGTPAFEKFVKNPFSGRLVTFDPGETTGYSVWDNSKLTDCGQLNTHSVRERIVWLSHWIYDIANHDSDQILFVMEEYRVYAWKAQDHAQSTMHTSRLIGAIECLLTQQRIDYVMQGAGIAKPFATDVKLKDWGFWQQGERHARDAIRHGAYYLCMGKPYVPGQISL